MYYEINVSRKKKDGGYYHWFATAKRSLTDSFETTQLLKVFMVTFPEPEHKITVSYHPEVSKSCDAKEFLNAPDGLYF